MIRKKPVLGLEPLVEAGFPKRSCSAKKVRSCSLTTSGGKAQKRAARTARLSAALRENLKRRKAQARGRAESIAENVKADERSSPADAAEGRQTPDFRRNRSRD
jgi:hypothetical protein